VAFVEIVVFERGLTAASIACFTVLVVNMKALLLDLDGVVRHFDEADVLALEIRHGLAGGSILSTAFQPHLLVPATTGELSRPEWAAAVGDELGSPQAAADWEALEAKVDWGVIEVVRKVRATGATVSLLTNGTSGIADELAALDIDQEFDHVFNSYDIGFVKPDHRIFQHVLNELRAAPGQTWYFDDSQGHVDSARQLGIEAHRFSSPESLRVLPIDPSR
jgi:HAD superfamily hydrolase (TIGR01509 family)